MGRETNPPAVRMQPSPPTTADSPIDILAIGASARSAVLSAVRGGLRCTAIDLFADADLQAICRVVKSRRYPHDLVELADSLPASPWLYTGGLENHAGLVDRLAQKRPLLGNGGGTLRRVRDPLLLFETMRDEGAPVAETRRWSAAAGADWLCKPLRSAGGRFIDFANEHPPTEEAYLQRFLRGTPHAAVYLAAGDRAVLLGVTQQLIGDFKELVKSEV